MIICALLVTSHNLHVPLNSRISNRLAMYFVVQNQGELEQTKTKAQFYMQQKIGRYILLPSLESDTDIF